MSKIIAKSKTFDQLKKIVDQYPQTITYYDRKGQQFILADVTATEEDFKSENIEIMSKQELLSKLKTHGVVF